MSSLDFNKKLIEIINTRKRAVSNPVDRNEETSSATSLKKLSNTRTFNLSIQSKLLTQSSQSKLPTLSTIL